MTKYGWGDPITSEEKSHPDFCARCHQPLLEGVEYFERMLLQSEEFEVESISIYCCYSCADSLASDPEGEHEWIQEELVEQGIGLLKNFYDEDEDEGEDEDPEELEDLGDRIEPGTESHLKLGKQLDSEGSTDEDQSNRLSDVRLPTISCEQLRLLGYRWEDMLVRLEHDIVFVDAAPCFADDGSALLWISYHDSAKVRQYNNVLADAQRFGDEILSVKQEDRLRLTGYVIRQPDSSFSLIVRTILICRK